MFVQFIKELPGSPHKAGETVEFPDAIGRSYADGGYAKEVSVIDHLRAQQAAQMADLKTDLTRAMTEAVKATPKPPHTPIDATEAAADRDVQGRASANLTPGEIARAMYWANAPDDDHRITDGMRDYARGRIAAWRKSKQAEPSQWVDRSVDNISRDNPGGVARDGAESGSAGAPTYGYLVRPAYPGDVFRIESETDVFTGLRQIPMGNAVEMPYPALDQYSTTTPTRTSNTFGGVTLYRKPEDGARTASDAKIGEIKFKVTDLTGMTKVSRDMMADSAIDLNAYLQDLFREAFGWRRDWDFLNGTGDGEPLGLLADNSPSVIRGGGVSGNATRAITGKIVYEDLAWMISKIWPAARRGMYWICNAQAASQLQAITNAAGNFVFQPNSMVSQAMMPSIYQGGTWDGVLMGFPVKLTEKAPALNTTGDLTLFCPRYFGEAQRAGLEVGLTEHRYWEYDQIGIRWKVRNDGRPMLRNYITGADGNTYSFAATLVRL
jgi:HK97 family phage major capsid protein